MALEGESAIVVPVPAAEPVVRRWRSRFDPSAAQGMPAHITLLYPFLPQERLSAHVSAQLRQVFAAVRAFDVDFRRTARFPLVLYLEPEPDGPIRQLTHALCERWPEAPPYGGAHEEVIPHLTVAHDTSPGVLDAVAADLAGRLPIRARMDEAVLYVFDGERWQARERLPFTPGCG